MPKPKPRSPKPAGRSPDSAGNRGAGGKGGRDQADLMPLDFMLALLRDTEASLDDRKWAAYHAAPYCHARLSTSDAGHDAPIRHEDALEALR